MTTCSRHPDRSGDFAVVLHYLGPHHADSWRNHLQGTPVDALCYDCRMALFKWLTTKQHACEDCGYDFTDQDEGCDACADKKVKP